MRPAGPSRVRWRLALVVGVLAAGFRYLLLNVGFPNDHFVYISGGWQMLSGDWPTRDWVDPGLPLQFLASATAQAVLGPTLFAEGVLVSLGFGVAAALTTVVVRRLTGSVALAVAAAALEVLILPRTYSYPKMLIYAAACAVFERHAARPTIRSMWWLSAMVVVAFLFRHDHGVFVGVGAALAVVLPPPAPHQPGRLRRLAHLALATSLLAAPYLAYVALNGGWWTYLHTGLDFAAQEAERQPHVWPAVFGAADPWRPALLYELHAIPMLALAVVAWRRDQARGREALAIVIPVAVMAAAINYSFLRDPLESRLPDAIVPAVVLGAWLCHRAGQSARPRLTTALAVACAAVFSVSVGRVGEVAAAVRQSGLTQDWDVPTLIGRTTALLETRRPERLFPSRASLSLRPFFSYLDRCTTLRDHLIVGGYLVEVPFFAERRFAGGQPYFGGSFAGSRASEARILARLAKQAVPFALLPSDATADFEREFPSVARHLRERYAPLTSVRVTDELAIGILVDTQLAAAGLDPDTGWPCYVTR